MAIVPQVLVVGQTNFPLEILVRLQTPLSNHGRFPMDNLPTRALAYELITWRNALRRLAKDAGLDYISYVEEETNKMSAGEFDDEAAEIVLRNTGGRR